MNAYEKNVFNKIMEAIRSVYDQTITASSKLFFIDAPGGTGKTFTFNTILAAVSAMGKVAIAVASSATAAQLLSGGTTQHIAVFKFL